MYRVEAELSGFKKAVRDGVIVQVNTTIRVDLNLEVGTVAETVNVVGESPLLQTDRTDTGRIIESVAARGSAARVEPQLSGRAHHRSRDDAAASRAFGVLQRAGQPVGRGERPVPARQQRAARRHRQQSQDRAADGADSVGGRDRHGQRHHEQLRRGVRPRGRRRDGGDAEVGHERNSREARRSAATRDATIAKNYFSGTKAPTKIVGYTFTLGGPIRRNRTFFFGDYQRAIDNAGRVQRSIIPPMEFRNGDFSRASTVVYNPFTGAANGTGRQPFAGNVIPASMISPIARRILALIPEPNIAGAALGQINYQLPYQRKKTTDAFDVKINHQVSDSNSLLGRFSYQRPEISDPGIYGIYGGGGKDFAGIGTNLTISTGATWTRVWSTTLVQEIRGGVSYYHNEAFTDAGLEKTSEELGISGVNINDFSAGITSVFIGGTAAASRSTALRLSASRPACRGIVRNGRRKSPPF